MKKFKYWYLTKCINICNLCLKFSDGAKDQEEVNEVISAKNFFIKQRDELAL